MESAASNGDVAILDDVTSPAPSSSRGRSQAHRADTEPMATAEETRRLTDIMESLQRTLVSHAGDSRRSVEAMESIERIASNRDALDGQLSGEVREATTQIVLLTSRIDAMAITVKEANLERLLHRVEVLERDHESLKKKFDSMTVRALVMLITFIVGVAASGISAYMSFGRK